MGLLRHKAIVHRFYDEAFNNGHLDVLDELLAPEIVAHDALPPGVANRGPEPYKQTITMLRTAFPDLHCKVHHVIAEGDMAAVRVTMTGVHHGDFLGIAPTGRRVRYPGMDFFRFADGKIVEHWTATDDLGLLQQVGVIPATERWSAPMPD